VPTPVGHQKRLGDQVIGHVLADSPDKISVQPLGVLVEDPVE
jgi:hypothetical protein